MRRAPRFSERLLDPGERVAVVVIPAYIFKQRQKTLEGLLVIDSTRLLDAVRYSLLQTLQRPLRKRDADHGNIEIPRFTIA